MKYVGEEGERQAGAASGQCHLVSLEKFTKQIADGIRFPGSSSFPRHLSHQILSSEGIRSTMPSVLALPWLQIHSHQQWSLTVSLERTQPGSANSSPWATSNLPPVLANKVSLANSHTHSFVCSLRLLLCYDGRAESLEQRPNDLQTPKYLLSGGFFIFVFGEKIYPHLVWIFISCFGDKGPL